MAVERQPVGEVRQQCLATRFYRSDRLADQSLFIGFQLRKGKPDIRQRFADNGFLQPIRRAANLWSFWHSVILLVRRAACLAQILFRS